MEKGLLPLHATWKLQVACIGRVPCLQQFSLIGKLPVQSEAFPLHTPLINSEWHIKAGRLARRKNCQKRGTAFPLRVSHRGSRQHTKMGYLAPAVLPCGRTARSGVRPCLFACHMEALSSMQRWNLLHPAILCWV